MTGSVSVYSVGLLLCITIALNAWQQHRRRGGLPLPPGPTGLPLLGNVLNINPDQPWLSYEQWGKRYGGIVYANMLGNDFIIINSIKVAHELLEKRSAIYSERPHMPANKLFGVDFNSGLLPYGNTWRLHRKIYSATFNKEATHQYKSLAISKAHQLVENLLKSPKDFAEHCQTFAAATIMATMYGYEVAPKNDPLVSKVDYFISLFAAALTPERTALLLAFPLLAHIPPWMPGGGYKQRATESRALAEEILTSPVEHVKENMRAGTVMDSVVQALLETRSGEEDVAAIKAVATSSFLGGYETTDSTLQMFTFAMVLHPEVQVKARQEIDRVVGGQRLPDFGDRPNLPYVEAVCLETLRWRPVVPGGVPHMTATSDVYEGMYIPKGAIVIANIWAMTHDETRFEDPMSFMPERHLRSDGTLAKRAVPPPNFGFGRRVCPGRYYADQNIWAAIATVLAVVRFAKARDELGNEIDVKTEFTSGASCAPKSFVCSITSRSSNAQDLVRKRSDDVQ